MRKDKRPVRLSTESISYPKTCDATNNHNSIGMKDKAPRLGGKTSRLTRQALNIGVLSVITYLPEVSSPTAAAPPIGAGRERSSRLIPFIRIFHTNRS